MYRCLIGGVCLLVAGAGRGATLDPLVSDSVSTLSLLPAAAYADALLRSAGVARAVFLRGKHPAFRTRVDPAVRETAGYALVLRDPGTARDLVAGRVSPRTADAIEATRRLAADPVMRAFARRALLWTDAGLAREVVLGPGPKGNEDPVLRSLQAEAQEDPALLRSAMIALIWSRMDVARDVVVDDSVAGNRYGEAAVRIREAARADAFLRAEAGRALVWNHFGTAAALHRGRRPHSGLQARIYGALANTDLQADVEAAMANRGPAMLSNVLPAWVNRGRRLKAMGASEAKQEVGSWMNRFQSTFGGMLKGSSSGTQAPDCQ